MVPTETEHVLTRFVSELLQAVPVVAVWMHGSLAMGDFQPRRSDLDLIAVVEGPLDAEQRGRVARIYRRLMNEESAAGKLHCSYMAAAALDDAETRHFTWANGGTVERPVTPVSRRELLDGGLALHGLAPADLLPPLGGQSGPAPSFGGVSSARFARLHHLRERRLA